MPKARASALTFVRSDSKIDVLITDEKPERLIGDKAYDSKVYDSDLLDAELEVLDIEMIAPHKSNRQKAQTQGAPVYWHLSGPSTTG